MFAAGDEWYFRYVQFSSPQLTQSNITSVVNHITVIRPVNTENKDDFSSIQSRRMGRKN